MLPLSKSLFSEERKLNWDEVLAKRAAWFRGTDLYREQIKLCQQKSRFYFTLLVYTSYSHLVDRLNQNAIVNLWNIQILSKQIDRPSSFTFPSLRKNCSVLQTFMHKCASNWTTISIKKLQISVNTTHSIVVYVLLIFLSGITKLLKFYRLILVIWKFLYRSHDYLMDTLKYKIEKIN